MSDSMTSEPVRRAGYWVWPAGGPRTTILFVGRGPRESRADAFHQLVGSPPSRLAWQRQIHSATVNQARDGFSGAGDALITDRRDLALSVATADCLPIVLASPTRLASLHAGWRGLAAGIIPRTVAALRAERPGLEAWIGPCIGACCYEVETAVAAKIAAVSGPQVVVAGRGSRPHLDLGRAAELQLLKAGVETTTRLSACTRCHREWLWSYRREGSSGGRNWTFAWLADRSRKSTPERAPISGDAGPDG